MSETATVKVQSVSTRQVGADKKTLWELTDGNGKVYATFIPGIGNAAIQYEGGTAVVEYSESTTEKNGTTYTNRRLESVHPAPAPAKGSPEYQEEDVDWDAKERRTYRSRAWAQAISASQHTAKSDETPKRIFERVKPLAHAIYNDICGDFAQDPPAPQQADIDPDDSIPF